MSFKNKGFSPVHVNSGPLAPRIFSYFDSEDLLSEILEPGYFNDKKPIMRPNSFVKVICKDAIVELIVDSNTSIVTMKDEFMRAVDPYKELIKSRSRRTAAQIKAAAQKAKLRKTG